MVDFDLHSGDGSREFLKGWPETQVFPKFQGRGKAAIAMLKERFQAQVADRVQFTAHGFWDHRGFLGQEDDNWIHSKPE